MFVSELKEVFSAQGVVSSVYLQQPSCAVNSVVEADLLACFLVFTSVDLAQCVEFAVLVQ